jgi:hypothetical protein
VKRTLAYLAAIAFVFGLVAFGSDAVAKDVAGEGSADAPVYVIYCDYDGPDAVLTPCGYMPASHVHLVGNGSIIRRASEGDYIYGPDGNIIEFVPTEEEIPNWVHRVDITKPWPLAFDTPASEETEE